MNYQNKGKHNDYRVNILNNGRIISVEVTCCGKHIGEMRFMDGENKQCPFCGTVHSIKIQHNHFHIRPTRSEAESSLADSAAIEKKAL